MTDSSAEPSAWHQLKAVPRCRCAASEAVGHDAMTQKKQVYSATRVIDVGLLTLMIVL